MINSILKGIFTIVISLVNVLLTPINLLIDNFLPELSTAFSLINSLFNTLFTYIGWVVDACFLTPNTISLVISCLTLRLTLPLLINTIKIAIKWYNSLKI